MKGGELLEDSRIIELYFERNEEAIPETERKYGTYCISVAENILGSEEDAKECLNDALLVLWNNIPPERPDSISAYVGRIVRNISLNRFRKNTAEKRGGTETAAVLEEISEFVSGKENPEKEAEEKELIGAINSFLENLPAEKRKIFVSRYWFFKSLEEISLESGKNKFFVHNTLVRTRAKLIRYLEERGFVL